MDAVMKYTFIVKFFCRYNDLRFFFTFSSFIVAKAVIHFENSRSMKSAVEAKIKRGKGQLILI